MPIEGYVDFTTHTEIRGWVYESYDPDTSLKVEIFADAEKVAVIDANLHRQDLEDAGKGNGRHAFQFFIPEHLPSANPLKARVPGQPAFLLTSRGWENQSHRVPRWHQQFQHTLECGLPAVPYGFTATPKCGEQDVLLAKRLIRAWHAAHRFLPDPDRQTDMWTEIERLFHREFEDILQDGDPQVLARHLSEFYSRPIAHGIVQGEDATKERANNPEIAAFVAAMFMDTLSSLAEAVGVLPVECAEQNGRYGENIFKDPDDLIDRIGAAIGVDVVPPAVAGKMFGLQTKRGLVQVRDLYAVWAALRIRDLTRDIEFPSVCEIGGGLGGVAYFAHELGIRNYVIFDLPNISVLQGYCLIRSLPGTHIILEGEDDPGGAAVRILPAGRFGHNARYNLVFNQDSLPEMHPSISVDYLRKARATADFFLSINQEAEAPQIGRGRQTVVQNVVAQAGGYQRLYRFPHWLRRGYVEEFYRTSPATP